MNNYSRLSGASSPSISTRPEWWRRPWIVSMAAGFFFGATASALFAWIDANKSSSVFGVGLIVWMASAAIVEVWCEGRNLVRTPWQAVGLVVAMAIFLPLLVTPKCGMWNDKCPVHHQVQRHVK